MILTLLLCVLVALTAQAMGPQEAGRAILPGAIIVDVRHGLLLPQGHSREELEPVIRDSLRILDLYLHETGGTNRPFRVKRSAAAKHLLTAKNIRTRVDERRRANVKLPCRGKARAKRSSRYALNAFSINPKPANKSGGYYTLFARVSEAVLQDLMARNPPAGESNLSRHHQSPNHYSGELFQYVVNSTAGQPRLPLPPKPEVHNLGHILSTEGLRLDPGRVEDILEMEKPKNCWAFMAKGSCDRGQETRHYA
ncbi:uncharacterized protein LOC142814754 isoform X2 [Rhipicephalus microplus]